MIHTGEFVTKSPTIEEDLVKTWKITPEVEQKNRVIDEILHSLGQKFTLNPFALFKYRLCLDEAITNSITHGCKKVDSPFVFVELYWSPAAWVVRILDPGPGFSRDRIVDFSEPGSELKESGRGIPILLQYADKLVFSQGGQEQTLWIRTGELLP